MNNSMKKTLVLVSVGLLLSATTALAAESKGTIDPVSGKPCYKCHFSHVNGPKLHDALSGNECTPCHSNTGGDHQKIRGLYSVKDKSAKLCWQCHDSVAGQKSVHPIIEEGCLGCHAPHWSTRSNLLRATPPELCFKCHDRNKVTEKNTQKATDFRDGQENLHYVHFTQNQIACLTCHSPHASNQLHMIRPKGFNGKEPVTITYNGTDKGGSCLPSCHDKMEYTRK